MSGWVMARGRENEVNLSEVTAAGVKHISLPGADGFFSVGQFLMISEADGAESQWLGKVTAVDAAGVSFSQALDQSKNTGARLWRAASTLEIAGMGALQERRKLEGGVAVERSLGGDFLAVKVAEPLTTASLQIGGLTPRNERVLLEWLATQAGWGLNAFTLIGPTGEMTACRLSGEALSQEGGKGTRRSVGLPIVLVGEGIYQ